MASDLTNRQGIALAAAEAIERRAAAGLEDLPALVGFDGFIDSMCRVVDRRRSMADRDFEPIRTIPDLARRIDAAAGRSTNMELFVQGERFGGNGPLLAAALGTLGVPVTFIGAVGDEGDPTRLHPVYAPLERCCRRVVPLAPPGRTEALEFDDGKIMFNKALPIQRVTWERLIEVVGLDALVDLCERARLIATTNWSLMGPLEGIWEGLIAEVFPRLRSSGGGQQRLFVDLSDPAKRTDADIARMLSILARMNAAIPVTLGLNLAEAGRIAGVLEIGQIPERGVALGEAAGAIRAAARLGCVVIHRRDGAAGADAGSSAWLDGPFVWHPRLSTGAGDHFNAGLAVGEMLELPMVQSLAVGCALSGAYVRDGAAPTLDRVLGLLRSFPEPEA